LALTLSHFEVFFGHVVDENQNNGHYAIQGHFRSPILVPIGSPYVTSYYWLILTYILSPCLAPFQSYSSLLVKFALTLLFRLNP